MKKGKFGEKLAAEYLQKNGCSIIQCNYLCLYGEIDIIVSKGEELIFVEVKHWNVIPVEELGYSINKIKKRKINDAALFFLTENAEFSNYSIRFDVIFIDNKNKINHLKNAFWEPEAV